MTGGLVWSPAPLLVSGFRPPCWGLEWCTPRWRHSLTGVCPTCPVCIPATASVPEVGRPVSRAFCVSPVLGHLGTSAMFGSVFMLAGAAAGFVAHVSSVFVY